MHIFKAFSAPSRGVQRGDPTATAQLPQPGRGWGTAARCGGLTPPTRKKIKKIKKPLDNRSYLWYNSISERQKAEQSVVVLSERQETQRRLELSARNKRARQAEDTQFREI